MRRNQQIDHRQFRAVAAEAGRHLGAVGGEAARAGFFMDMLAKWLWNQKSDLLEISGKGVDIHNIDEAAEMFCHFLYDKGGAGYTQLENPQRFIPTLKERAMDRQKSYTLLLQ